MTRIDALSAWLKTNVRLKAVFKEVPEVVDDELPGALIEYDGDRASDTLNADERIERYVVTLMTPLTGAEDVEIAEALAQMERTLVIAARSPARASTQWDHLEAAFLQANRDQGQAQWLVSVYVEGE